MTGRVSTLGGPCRSSVMTGTSAVAVARRALFWSVVIVASRSQTLFAN
jgi:hypothetical protein